LLNSIIITVVLVSLLIWITFRKSRAQKKRDKELELSLEDETIYDPVTGKRLTLEEAETAPEFNHYSNGEFSPGKINESIIIECRIKPDTEIEKYFEDEAKEIQYILRDFYKEKLQPCKGSELFIYILEQTEMAKRLNSIDFYEFYDLSENASIGLANVAYEIFTGDGAEMYGHVQLFGFRILENGEKISLKNKDIDFEQRGNMLIIRGVKKLERTDYQKFKSILMPQVTQI